VFERVSQKVQASQVSPLLRSIAREIVERTAAIVQLECRLEAVRGDSASGTGGPGHIAPRLANHRSELRLAEAELNRLGWKRDASAPLRFLRAAGGGMAWQPEETSFFLALRLSWSA
jgi:hypothetical protein